MKNTHKPVFMLLVAALRERYEKLAKRARGDLKDVSEIVEDPAAANPPKKKKF